jgi:hypothetical protein
MKTIKPNDNDTSAELKLSWMDFASQCCYSYDVLGTRVVFQGPMADQEFPNHFTFTLNPSLGEGAFLAEHILPTATPKVLYGLDSGVVNVARLRWPGEVETDDAIHIQGSLAVEIQLFHSDHLTCQSGAKIQTHEHMIEALLRLNRMSAQEADNINYTYPKAKSDISVHELQGRKWYETLLGYLSGIIRYKIYTRVNDSVVLCASFSLSNFWRHDALPDPAHKRAVFESVLDFLSHFQFIAPEDIDRHPELLAPGFYPPNSTEKNILPEPEDDPALSGW